ncbi:hypothetical protein CFC21_060018 [Triticum aestivum]|uniref:DUF4220 domain-containing protein n=2 Tax=Triticum aestivum TaxID=4565 RepID=A0A9R1GRF3_WHEAT|nr:uncharacterized protein LOC123099288 [Triticum aestivum]KAF7051823.1 hypothetical protein CFC21_060018 [Triticum aestivum]
MSLSGAVGWWDEWQLRILVLASLFMQYLLYLCVWLRRSPSMSRMRVLVWIVYIGSDAVAIYALATLFNRQKQTLDGGSTALEVLWAPVLLIHLGGQPFISAYSLEDNELWKRHTITLVSQVTVALYVFCKWWSGEKRLLAAGVLLFLFGILKFAQKPWALRTASFNSMPASLQVEHKGRTYSLEEYVQDAKKCLLDTEMSGGRYGLRSLSNYMFVDRSVPYSLRIKVLSGFMHSKYEYEYKELRSRLGDTFSMLYTRVQSFGTIYGSGFMFFLPFLALSSIVLLATSRKDGHEEKDITVTYILFCFTAMLEFLLPCMVLSYMILAQCISSFSAGFLMKHFEGWHDMVSQCNIMSFCVRKKKPTFLMKLAAFNFLREFVNQHWYIKKEARAYQITGVVRQHVEDGWKNYICGAESYRKFNELRGQWALRRHKQIGWSLKMNFDKSVLLWHIATDLCFYHPNTSHQCRQQAEATLRSREISNYMIYLLLIRPEMLMLGSRSDLFTMASNQIGKDMTEEILAGEILSMPPSSDNMISDARRLAQELMVLDSEEDRWIVIQGVWVEMLCYSASRCRGYLHAKSLGDGGECLTTIWLLLAVMGMETLADRNHRPKFQDEEEKVEEIELEEALPVNKKDEKKNHILPSCSQGRAGHPAHDDRLV